MPTPTQSRRDFLATTATLLGAAALARTGLTAAEAAPTTTKPEPIIDIHQHIPYSGRTSEQMMAHQVAMGVSFTILLPAGSRFGLAAGVNPYPEAQALAEKYPDRFAWFANEVTDQPDAVDVIRRQLKSGAIGIGEQKFNVTSDSPGIEHIAALAAEFEVPMLLHFQQGTYNNDIHRFHRILEKFPTVNFIGHAQTFWGNISKNYDEKILYPKGPVVPGGITDRLLSDYPNMYGDLSAGSGYQAFIRDEDHAHAFFARHQDKLLYGSDCSDPVGHGPACSGFQQIGSVRRFSPDKKAERKILYGNARRVLKLKNLPF
jgi:predicted TIM-barrel fold metal-dependent hydrolase